MEAGSSLLCKTKSAWGSNPVPLLASWEFCCLWLCYPYPLHHCDLLTMVQFVYFLLYIWDLSVFSIFSVHCLSTFLCFCPQPSFAEKLFSVANHFIQLNHSVISTSSTSYLGTASLLRTAMLSILALRSCSQLSFLGAPLVLALFLQPFGLGQESAPVLWF